MKKTITVAALLSIIAVCMVVVARNFAPVEDDGYVPARERAIIKKFDADGDGKLNQEERRTADDAIQSANDRKQERIRKFDKDGDGKLSREEREVAGRERAAADRAAIIKKFDTDGDGKLNEAEKAAAREATARP